MRARNVARAAEGGEGFIPGPNRGKFRSSPRKFSETLFSGFRSMHTFFLLHKYLGTLREDISVISKASIEIKMLAVRPAFLFVLKP